MRVTCTSSAVLVLMLLVNLLTITSYVQSMNTHVHRILIHKDNKHVDSQWNTSNQSVLVPSFQGVGATSLIVLISGVFHAIYVYNMYTCSTTQCTYMYVPLYIVMENFSP